MTHAPAAAGRSTRSATVPEVDTGTPFLASIRLMRYLLLGFLVPALGLSAILPDAIATYHRGTPTKVTLPAADAPLWEEYGLKASETAVYDDAGKHLTVTAF